MPLRVLPSVISCPSVWRSTLLALVIAAGGFWISPVRAAVLFSDAFNYPNGNLSGNNGGSGWSGAWSGGLSQVVNPLAGTYEKSVRFAADASVTTRQPSGSITTGTSSTFVSFIFNANPFQAGLSGDYAGISLLGLGSGSLFMGMPGASSQLGFDWSVNNVGTEGGLYAAANNTNYLTLFEIKPGPATGSNDGTAVTMYVTSNLQMSAATLLATGSQAAATNGNFTFNTVEIAGGYANGSINVTGFAVATTANEAVGFTQLAVPEPGTLLLGSLAAALAACVRRYAAGASGKRR